MILSIALSNTQMHLTSMAQDARPYALVGLVAANNAISFCPTEFRIMIFCGWNVFRRMCCCLQCAVMGAELIE